MPQTLLLELLITAALIAGVGWKSYELGGEHARTELAQYKEQQAQDALKAEADARAKETAMRAANDRVKANYESLKTATATAVGAVDADRLRLQEALTSSDPTANPSARACADDAARTRTVVRACATALQKLAGAADATEDQLVGLQEYVTKVLKP
ncbi:MAG: hypothetical protein HXX17_08210 [Geobacteraceae bacterium]|nr:hypothetical protein [Geobacteraceae bacterium]